MTHAKQKQYASPTCDFQAKNKCTVDQHLKRHSLNPNEPVKQRKKHDCSHSIPQRPKKYIAKKVDRSCHLDQRMGKVPSKETMSESGEKSDTEMISDHMESHEATTQDTVTPSEVDETHDQAMFKCHLCAFQTDMKCKLNRHMMTRHTEKEEQEKAVLDQRIFHCTLCNFQTERKLMRMEHVCKTQVSEDTAPKITEKTLAIHGSGNDSNINEHNSNISEDNSILKDQFQCGFCESSRPTVGSLITHIQCSHRKLFKCDKCPFTTRTNTTLLLHAISHNKVNKVNYGATNNKDMGNRSNTDNSNNSSCDSALNCTICGMFMSSYENLLRHLKCSHNASLQCTICDFKTVTQECYDQHMETHTKEAPCKYFDFVAKGRSSTKNLENLKKHVDNTHRQPQHLIIKGPQRIQHSCTICDFKTTSKELFRTHICKHEEKKYSCLSCNFRSKGKNTMRRHMLCHASKPSLPV